MAKVKVDYDRLRRALGIRTSEKRKPRRLARAASARIGGDARLRGKKILFTGKLGSGFTRAEAEKLVREAGGEVVGHVAKDLDYLVVGDAGSKRYGSDNKLVRVGRMQAEGHKVRVVSEREFLAFFGIKYGTF